MKKKIEKINATIADYEKMIADHEKSIKNKIEELEKKQTEYQMQLEELNSDLADIEPDELDSYFSKVSEVKAKIDSIINLRQKVSPSALNIDTGAFLKAWDNEVRQNEKDILKLSNAFYDSIQAMLIAANDFHTKKMAIQSQYTHVGYIAKKINIHELSLEYPKIPNLPIVPLDFLQNIYTTNHRDFSYNGREITHN